MFRNLALASLVPIALLAVAQPAEARRLFWWETVNPDAPPQAYYDPQDPYADPYGDGGYTPEDRFNQRQYELYRREMKRRYGYANYQDPNLDYGYDVPPPPPYADPVYPPARRITKPKKPVIKAAAKPKPAINLPANPGSAQAAASASATPAAAQTAATTGASANTSCDKGQGIVTSFGFTNVSSKSCGGKTLVYNAERGGTKFEVEVNSANGELTAVKKL